VNEDWAWCLGRPRLCAADSKRVNDGSGWVVSALAPSLLRAEEFSV
jgi:hypothetical protein